MKRHLAISSLLAIMVGTLCYAQQYANPVLLELAQPKYPPLARQANVIGDVVVAVVVKNDGAIQSAVVISGHPLLKQSALDSASQSKFDCSSCNGSGQYRLVYSFKLAATENCCNANHEITVTREPETHTAEGAETHIILAGEHICLCDPAFTITKRVRSIKCLSLWKCSTATQ